jgi:hypothetical protein
MAAMKKSVKTLVDNGFTRADAEALTEAERAEMIATLPPASVIGIDLASGPDETAVVEARVVDGEVASIRPLEGEEAEAALAGETEAELSLASQFGVEAPAEAEPSDAEVGPDEPAEAEPGNDEAEPEGEPLDGVVLNMVAEPEPEPFNAGVQHQLEMKWQEFASFAKTVEHKVEGDLSDIVGWIKAHA